MNMTYLRSRMMQGAGLMVAAGAMVLGGAAAASADSGAHGAAIGSPGVLSGNVIQIPVNIPINACGNTVDVIGLLNPAFGNTCVNTGM
ncbi:chaplin [Streptomyces sp. NBC_01435]|uniref:chaplin n=1 Tax=Streptomyces sp. NBC_01435 TaxID=2903865 RepID=UPI003FCC6AEE